MTAEPVILSWSGGKDSALALVRLQADARFDVAALLTTVTADYDRISVHGVRRSLLAAQADALGLPVHEVTLPARCSNEQYEDAFGSALRALHATYPAVRRIAFGDIFLADVKRYREELVARHGFEALFPLWGESSAVLAEEVLTAGIAARLVCVDTHALPGSFAGRMYDRALLAELPPGTDPCGENGEFHTFVSDGACFRYPVDYDVGDAVLRDDRFMYRDLV